MTDRAALDALVARVRDEGVALDETVAARLAHFVAGVREWSARVNLVSRRELDRIVEKHVAPSLVPLLVSPAETTESVRLVDVGSGGGFPGLVLAIARPAWRVHLIEPTRKKALFLERVAREVGNVEVWRRRAEACHTEGALRAAARYVTSRAVAPPAEVWPLIEPFLAPDGEMHVFVSREAHASLAERLLSAHPAVELLPPVEPSWWQGAVLRARRRDDGARPVRAKSPTEAA